MKDIKKLEIFYHRFEHTVCDFNGGFYPFTGRRFKPYREGMHIDDGLYITVRCGFSGIYTMLNDMKDGKWVTGVLDGSTTIAFATLTKIEKEEYNNIVSELKGCL